MSQTDANLPAIADEDEDDQAGSLVVATDQTDESPDQRPQQGDADGGAVDDYLGGVDESQQRLSNIQNETRGVLDRIRDRANSKFRGGVHPRRVDDAVRNRIQQRVKDMAADGDGRLLRIKPHPDGQGIDGGEGILKSLFSEYERSRFGLRNVSPVQSFEIWMVEGEIVFHIYAHNQKAERRIRQQIDAQYPNASAERVWDAESVNAFLERSLINGDRENGDDGVVGDVGDVGDMLYENRSEVPLPDVHIPLPPLDDVEYAAAADFTLRHSRAFPIKSPRSMWGLDNDPYQSITSTMLADERNHFVFQVTFKPATRRWARTFRHRLLPHKKDSAEATYHWQQIRGSALEEAGGLEGDGAHVDEERRYADEIRARVDRPAFHTNIRVLGFGADREIVGGGVEDIIGDVEGEFQEWKQRFCGHVENGTKLLRQIDRCVGRDLTWKPWFWFLTQPRKWKRQEPVLLPTNELGTLCHLPNGEIETPDIDWELKRSGAAVPKDAEKFGEMAAETDPIPLTTKPKRDNGAVVGDVGVAIEATDDRPDQPADDERDSGDGSENNPAPVTGEVIAKDDTESGTSRDQGRSGIGWLDNLLHPDESVLYRSHPTWWVSTGPYAGTLGFGVIGLLVMLLTVVRVDTIVPELPIGTLPTEAAAIGGAIIFLGIIIAGYERTRRRNEWYIVTDKKIILKTGILSQHTEKHPFTQVTSAKASQTFLQRRLQIGTIEVYTASTEGLEMRLTGVRNVKSVARLISEQVSEWGRGGTRQQPQRAQGDRRGDR